MADPIPTDEQREEARQLLRSVWCCAPNGGFSPAHEKAVALALASAVQAERERCAEVLDAEAERLHARAEDGHGDLLGIAAHVRNLASAIRRGP